MSATFLAGVGGFMTFQVNFNVPVIQTNLAAYIRFMGASNNVQYYSVDARTATIVNNITLVFRIPVNSLGTGSYYIIFDYGVALNDQFCRPVSNQVTSTTFWPIRITATVTTVATSSTTVPSTTTTFPTIFPPSCNNDKPEC